MKIIEWKPGHREVELEGNERNLDRYTEELLDEGWDFDTALRYAERRFGRATPTFRQWFKGEGFAS